MLENVYGIDLLSFVDEMNLFKAAVAYYNQFDVDLPDIFVERLKEVVLNKIPFIQTELVELFESRSQFDQFVNQQWTSYVNQFQQHSDQEIADGIEKYQRKYFADSYIQSKLVKLVKPVEVDDLSLYDEWMHEGLVSQQIEVLFPTDYLSFSRDDWFALASRIGKEQAILLEKNSIADPFVELVSKANSAFEIWIQANFSNLRTLPSVPTPKMVHQIPHYLKRRGNQKIALIVLDGMSFTQWYTIKKFLSGKGISFEEHALLSWVPSVTSVSRQTIFSGKEPRYFATTIDTTRREKQYWEEFWQDQGFSKFNIAYDKSLGFEVYNANHLSYRKNPDVRIYGAVIDVIDQIMHGATQGIKTIQSELNNWLSSNYLCHFLMDLLTDGFEVYITSDHGNVECIGRGRIPQGVTVDTKGERFRSYQSKIIRNQTAIDNPDTIIWNDTSLPEDYFVLLANDKQAFTNKNDKIVTHGGIHIEEMIVPFVKVTR